MEGDNTKVSNRENSFDLIKFSSGSTTDDLAAAESHQRFGSMVTQLRKSNQTVQDMNNKYRVRKMIGQGSEGDVFLAEDISTGAKVTIKRVRGFMKASYAAK